MSDAVFIEVQRQIPKTIVAVTVSLLIIIEIILIWSSITSEDTVPWPAFITITAIIIFLIHIAMFLRTTVTVTNDKIFIKTIPTRTISIKDVKNCEIVDIKALSQFGGWGIRYTWKKIGYISYQNKMGVSIHIEGMKDVVISSSKPEELKDAIMRSK